MSTAKKIKLPIKLLLRAVKDLVKIESRFAKKCAHKVQYTHSIAVTQKIMPSDTFENKVFNLTLAAQKVSEYEMMPNEIFSFWKIVGNPNYDFKKGRTLQNGQIKEETGGGICQVSGIVYHVSVIAGLEILERYNHSMDIYTEETRFAPLGLDATVVYGYKDLRIKNNFPFSVKFEVKVFENQIKAELLSTEAIRAHQLIFESKTDNNLITVQVLDENKTQINQSKYKKYGSD